MTRKIFQFSIALLSAFVALPVAQGNNSWLVDCKKKCSSCSTGQCTGPDSETYSFVITSQTEPTAQDIARLDANCAVESIVAFDNMGMSIANSPGITAKAYKRESTVFNGASPTQVKYETIGGIRKPLQLPAKHVTMVYSDLADGTGFQISQYSNSILPQPDTNGIRAISSSAQPMLVTIFRNPDGANANGRMDVIHKTRHPQTGAWVTRTIRTFAPQGNNSWKREWFLGDLSTNANLQAYREITTDRTPQSNGTEQVHETTKDRDSAGNLVITRDVTRSYAFYKYGSPALLSETQHSGLGASSELTSSWTYYTDAKQQASFNKPATLRRNDGQWANYTYSGNPVTGVLVTKTVSGWLDQPAPAVGEAANDNASRVVTEIEARHETGTFSREEKIQGVLVSKTWGEKFKANSGEFVEKTNVETGTSTLTTTRTGYADDESAPEAQRGRLKSVQNPDGTVVLYSYQMQGANRVETVDQGAGTLGAVTDGTRTISTYTADDTLIKQVMSDIASGIELKAKEVIAFDSNQTPTRWAYNHNPDDYSETIYGCCGVESERSRDGIVTTYTRDALKRPVTSVSQGITTTYTYGQKTIGSETFLTATSVKSAGGLTQNLGTSVSDHAGNVIEQISPDLDGDGLEEVTTTSRDVAGRMSSTTNPEGSTVASVNFADGQSKSTTGTASSPSYFAYATNNQQGGGLVTSTAPTASGPWTKSYSNLVGRTLKTTFDEGSETTLQSHSFDALGRLVKTSDADGVTQLIAYNAKGEAYRRAVDLNGNGQIDNADRISETLDDIANVPNFGPALRSRSIVYDEANNAITVGTRLRSPDGTKSSQQMLGVSNASFSQSATVIDRADGEWSDTITAPDGTKRVAQYSSWLLVSNSSLNTDSLPLETSSIGYDALRRPVTSTHSRTGIITTTYAANGQVASIDDHSRITSFTYDKMGRMIATTLPDNSVKHTSYWASGQVKAEWGSQTYPTVKFYNDKGQLIKLRTFRSANLTLAPDESTTGFDETNWIFNSRGQVERKVYADGKGPSYTYTSAGRLHTRTWARIVNGAPLVTTYGYNSAGELVSSDYSDTTPDVAVTFDKLGRQTCVSNGIAKSEYAYDPATLRLDKETISYNLDEQPGFEFVRVLDRSQDAMGRDTGWQLKCATTVENEVAYDYNLQSGRLATVATPSGTFSYSYTSNSALLAQVTGPAHTVSNTWLADRDALQKKENKAGTTLISSFDYGVNAMGQRTGVATSGTAFANNPSWVWEYDSLGQVTKVDSSNNAHDRTYQFDAIGNRKKSADSLSLPTGDNYTASELNQYSSISNQTSTINPSYDSDGNATSYPLPASPDNLSTLAWDAENRLISTIVDGLTTSYLYDSQSRRIAKVSGVNGTAYLYDAWNCVGEYLATNNSPLTINKFYVWGRDLSGSIHGVGGVSGLLSVSLHNHQSTISYYPTCDGNGNVSEYITTAGAVACHFEYDAFGNTVVNTDTAGQFNYRFSTKLFDVSTGLYCYGYRYLNPVSGRWLNRDSIWENGGYNLYALIANDAINKIDILGLTQYTGTYNCECDRAEVNKVIADMAKKAALESAKDLMRVPEVIRKKGNSTGREFGGKICCDKKNKKITTTGPSPSAKGWSIDPKGEFWAGESIDVYSDTPECSEGYEIVAYYHSHPSGSSNFSIDDRDAMRSLKVPLAVGTEKGQTNLLEPIVKKEMSPHGVIQDITKEVHGFGINDDGSLTPKPVVPIGDVYFTGVKFK